MADENQSEQPVEVNNRVMLPEAQRAGILADVTNVWHTDNYFVLDFMTQASTPHPEPVGPGVEQIFADYTISSRVKILPEQILPLVQALQAQSDHWIQVHNQFGDPDHIANGR